MTCRERLRALRTAVGCLFITGLMVVCLVAARLIGAWLAPAADPDTLAVGLFLVASIWPAWQGNSDDPPPASD